MHVFFLTEIGSDIEWAFPILRNIPGLSNSRKKKESFEGCHEFFEVKLIFGLKWLILYIVIVSR